MSRAEELSQNRYPTLAEKYAFIDGYETAEKDLELTYDDICEIMEIREDVLEMDSYENLYEEILKRFKK